MGVGAPSPTKIAATTITIHLHIRSIVL